MAESKPKDRVTVRLSGRVGAAIEEIQNLTPAESPTDVVRRALMLYHKLCMEKAEGKELVILDPTVGNPPKKSPIFL